MPNVSRTVHAPIVQHASDTRDPLTYAMDSRDAAARMVARDAVFGTVSPRALALFAEWDDYVDTLA